MDADREYFKAAIGSERRQAPRDVSFCGHAITGEGPFLVSDTLADPRFADNPGVLGGAHVRFYAGVPMTTPDVYAIGALCVKDTRPRRLSARQTSALVALGPQVVVQLELRRLLRPVRALSTT